MKRLISTALLAYLFFSCNPSKITLQNKQLIVAKWKSSNPDKYADWDIYDSTCMHLLLRNEDQTVDSIWWQYKIDKKYFYIYTKTFLASKNKVLTLTIDSFSYCRPKDKDTFRFAKFR